MKSRILIDGKNFVIYELDAGVEEFHFPFDNTFIPLTSRQKL